MAFKTFIAVTEDGSLVGPLYREDNANLPNLLLEELEGQHGFVIKAIFEADSLRLMHTTLVEE